MNRILLYRIAILFCLMLCVGLRIRYKAQKEYREATMLRGINIGNALESPRDVPWTVTMDIAFFDTIKEAGFNTVRLPIRFSDYVGSGPDYILDEAFMQEIDRYIDRAMELNLTLILDLHHFEELMAAPAEYEDMFYAIWTQLAVRYQHYPEELIFELLNEPRDNLTPQIWNEVFIYALDCVRVTNPTRKVIVDAPWWGSAAGLVQLRMPDDANVIASFHYYEPMIFTFQGDEYHPNYTAYHNIQWTGIESEMAVLMQTFAQVEIWAEEQGVEVLLGEFGANELAPTAARLLWTQAVIQEAEAHDFSWCYWELGAQFGIYDIETRNWDKDMLSVMLPQDQ